VRKALSEAYSSSGSMPPQEIFEKQAFESEFLDIKIQTIESVNLIEQNTLLQCVLLQ